jgi:hypothetical protein
MAPDADPKDEVLHSENHSKLTSEEIAKAVARHNKNHSPAKAENAVAKAQSASLKGQNAPDKAKKRPKP